MRKYESKPHPRTRRKSDSTLHVLLRCDGGNARYGTGHLVRCRILARALHAQSNVHVTVITRRNPTTRRILEGKGEPFDVIDIGRTPERAALESIVRTLKPNAVILDRLVTPSALIRALQRKGLRVVALDDRGAGGRAADATVNAILETPGHAYSGPKYIVIERPGKKAAIRKRADRVFVCFGGLDPHGLTKTALRKLSQIPGIRADAVVGSRKEKAALGAVPSGFNVHVRPKSFYRLLESADLALVSGGLLLFDALAHGVPTLVVAQYPHQADTARRYASRGAARFLGTWREMECGDVAEKVRTLLADVSARRKLGRTARALVDGRGAQRVASIIIEAVKR